MLYVDPFKNVDLTTIDSTTIDNLNTMREAAESAETDQFNSQIAAASGAAGAQATPLYIVNMHLTCCTHLLATALQNGKIKNKVLKLTGEVQVLNIKIAQAKTAGKSTTSLASDLAAETYVVDHLLLPLLPATS